MIISNIIIPHLHLHLHLQFHLRLLLHLGSEGNPKDGQNPNINPRGEAVALIEGQENGETEKIVPIWGEANSCNKRKIKLGEVVIRKRRIIETKKFDVDIKKEKASVEYPDGFKEEQTSNK